MSTEPIARPAGDYAIVELFGHTTLVGRIAEVERFGTKMLALEPLFRDELLPAVYHGGAAIYRLTPCSADVAFARQPQKEWQIPAAIRCIVPPAVLAAATEPDDPADWRADHFTVAELHDDSPIG